MKTAVLESVPTTWDDARDGAFFRLVADVFHPDFLLGATVLLGSYDDELTVSRGTDEFVPTAASTFVTVTGLSAIGRVERS